MKCKTTIPRLSLLSNKVKFALFKIGSSFESWIWSDASLQHMLAGCSVMWCHAPSTLFSSYGYRQSGAQMCWPNRHKYARHKVASPIWAWTEQHNVRTKWARMYWPINTWARLYPVDQDMSLEFCANRVPRPYLCLGKHLLAVSGLCYASPSPFLTPAYILRSMFFIHILSKPSCSYILI